MRENLQPFRLIEEGFYRREAIVFAETEDAAERLRHHIDTEWKWVRLEQDMQQIEPFDP